VVAQGTLREVEHPEAGRMIQPRPPSRFGRLEAFPERPSPGLGDHTDDVLSTLGYSHQDITTLREQGAIG
jgi:crotonobetainyl-CoA:carnitine CoA-transferase CaiB-like acyl-CoA transferase